MTDKPSLKQLLTDIANSIRSKTGSIGKIHAQDLVATILKLGKQVDFEPITEGRNELHIFLSNLAAAIRSKDSWLLPSAAENAYNIPSAIKGIKTKLDTPSIKIANEFDTSDLPDMLDYITYEIDWGGHEIDIGISVDEFEFLDRVPVNYPGVVKVTLFGLSPIYRPSMDPEKLNITGADCIEMTPRVIYQEGNNAWYGLDLSLVSISNHIKMKVRADTCKLETPSINLYSTVTYMDEKDNILYEEEMAHGEMPRAFIGNLPSKDGDGIYDYYVFRGWLPHLSPVTGPITYIPNFVGATKKKCTVTWKNYNGDILKISEDVHIGVLPTYDGALPLKPFDSQYAYAFKGWDKAILPLVEDTVYTAEFTIAPRLQMVQNEAGGLTYIIVSKTYAAEENNKGGITYSINEAIEGEIT